jgi:hypothetical protein
MQISAAKREKEATEATVDSLEENDPVRNSSITR